MNATGCYCTFWDFDENYTNKITYSIDDHVDFTSVTIFPDEASASSITGGINVFVKKAEGVQDCAIRDFVIVGFSFLAESVPAWGDSLHFDFPVTITPDQLIENSGDPAWCGAHDYNYYCNGETKIWTFEFDENNQLITATLSNNV